jgi:hypothetical protein
MATVYWLGPGTAGATSWATGSNWSGGSAPTTGDTVFINNLTNDITSGLGQSAVTLAALYVIGGTGTIGVAGDAGAYLDIGWTNGLVNCGLTRLKLNAGTVNHTTVVQATGGSADVGRAACQIKGGNTASAVYVTGGTVGLAEKPGETATLSELDVKAGTATCGSGLTCPTMKQSGEEGQLNVYGSTTTLTQNSGTLNTFGTGAITTAVIDGTANFNHRPSGDAFQDLTVNGNGTADFSGDPRQVRFTNNPVFRKGGKVTAFNNAQLKKTGPANFSFSLPDSGFEGVTLDLGEIITVTIS